MIFQLDFGDKTQLVAQTALRLVARMKRDWILTGRRPAGICGAALLISAWTNGFKCTLTEIGKVCNLLIEIALVNLRFFNSRLFTFVKKP